MRKDLFEKNYINSYTKYVSLYNLDKMTKEQRIYLFEHGNPWIIVPCPWEPGDDTYVKLHEAVNKNGEYLDEFKREYL